MTEAVSRHSDAWWLEGGGEQCEFCLRRYVYEVEVRCVACDAPVCPLCVVRVRETLETYCPSCPPGEE